jgi:hypothetical protein
VNGGGRSHLKRGITILMENFTIQDDKYTVLYRTQVSTEFGGLSARCIFPSILDRTGGRKHGKLARFTVHVVETNAK